MVSALRIVVGAMSIKFLQNAGSGSNADDRVATWGRNPVAAVCGIHLVSLMSFSLLSLLTVPHPRIAQFVVQNSRDLVAAEGECIFRCNHTPYLAVAQGGMEQLTVIWFKQRCTMFNL